MESDDEIPIPKGSYSIDFDKIDLDSINPFGTKKALQNSPVKTNSPVKNFEFPHNNHIVNNEIESSLYDNVSKPQHANVGKEDLLSLDNNIDLTTSAKTNDFDLTSEQLKQETNSLESNNVESEIKVEDKISIPRGTYSLNFDDIDAIDPFSSSKGLINSPTKTKKDPFKSTNALQNFPTTTTDSKISLNDDLNTDINESNEINITENRKPKSTDPPKNTKKTSKLSKRPGLAKRKFKKPAPVIKNTSEEENDIPIPSKGYTIDFDNLENIDPFKSSSSNAMQNSPTKALAKPIFSKENDQSKCDDIVIGDEKSNTAKANEQKSSFDGLCIDLNNAFELDQNGDNLNIEIKPELSDLQSFHSNSHNTKSTTSNSKTPLSMKSDLLLDSSNELLSKDNADMKQNQLPVLTLSEDEEIVINLPKTISEAEQEPVMPTNSLEESNGEGEEFYPARDVFENLDALNYLDSKGTYKVNKRTKNARTSLYRDFDPLFQKSPKANNVEHHTDEKTKARSTNFSDTSVKQVIKTESSVDPDYLPITTNMADSQSAMDTFFSHSQKPAAESTSELKFTESDLQRVLASKKQSHTTEVEKIAAENRALHEELTITRKVISGYEDLISQMSKDKNWNLTSELKTVKSEHEAALDDLHSVVNSHADLSRRYEKLKIIVRNHKENESKLKQKTEEAIATAKVAHEKYITAKNEMTEAINNAQNELKKVQEQCAKDVSVADAQLKMQELKCSSLERELREQEHQAKELAKLCDELIERAQHSKNEE